MALRPYDTRQLVDRFRIYSDVGIASLYAYLLFTLEPLITDPTATLVRHLIGYPLVFLLYLASGLLRLWVYGKEASKPCPIVGWLVLYVCVVVGYGLIRSHASYDPEALNVATVSITFLLMVGYRWFRRYLVGQDEQRATRLVIGIDVDGVLADQITDVLPIVKEKYDVTITYGDITDWRLPIKNSNIEVEILRAQQSRDYVVGMGVHQGARRLLTTIGKVHRIVIITARKGEAATVWTKEWLNGNGLPYHEVIASGEARKSEHRTNVLIDDFVGNVAEFLENTQGVAVLVDQPWNRERQELEEAFANQGRLFVVSNLLELRIVLPEIIKCASSGRMMSV